MQESEHHKIKDKKGGGRGRETIFRVAARNQIELIAIADNKSNMIIGICVVLISLVIAMLGSGLLFGAQPIRDQLTLVVPLGILVVFSLAAAVNAILAAKPHIIKGDPTGTQSLLFFQNIYKRTQDEYLEEMHGLIDDRKKVYDQLIIDMYNNGVVLHRKYSQLSVAYQLFMIGLIVSVVSFGILLIFT